MPDPENAEKVLESTHDECVKHASLFESARQSAQRPLAAIREGAHQLSVFQQEQLTRYVSTPVHEHFKTHGPGYLQSIKADHDPDDGWVRWAQKGVYNTSVDLVAKYAHLAINPIQTFLHDTAKKVPKETFRALNPLQLTLLSTHHPMVQEYFAQRVDQLMTPVAYWRDFHGAFQKSVIQAKGGFQNMRSHLGALEGGPKARAIQFKDVVIDMTEQTIAGKLGVAMAIFGLYRLPTFHQRTQTAYNSLFPRGTWRGMWGRPLPVRLMFSKPLARVVGNPVLSLTVVTYLTAMSMANAISDSLELKQKHPDVHGRLATSKRDIVRAPFHLKVRDTISDIQKKG